MKTYSFEIESEFGFFQWQKTKGDHRITNLFISKTDVLGILGCIIGLDGYAQEYFREENKADKKETFYNALKGLRVSIIPKNEPALFEDHLIHRHMVNVNKKGSLMAKIFGLIKPKYKIVFQQGSIDQNVFEKMVEYLKSGWSEFIPYAGKNNFPIEIINFKEEKIEEKQKGEAVIQSMFLEEKLIEQPYIDELDLRMEGGSFYYLESLKFFKEDVETPSVINKNMIWTSYEVCLNDAVYLTEAGENVVFY